MSLQVEVGRTGLFIQIDETVLNLNTSQITVVSGNADTLNGQAGSYYLNRANHTGTQAITTIDNLRSELDLKLDAADYNDRFLGLYASFFDLVAAHPTASAGDYAQVDLGIGSDVIIYAWDDDDEQWAAVGSSAIANTDALPEGSSNLYFTTQRVRDATLTGFSPTNSAIISTDNVVQAFGKAQGQINAISGINSDRTLLYTTPTPNKPITNSTINVIEDLNERLFDANYIITANSLAVGDVYEVDAQILVMRSATVGSQAVVIVPYLNGSVVAPLGTATSSNASANAFFTISVTIRYAVREIGVSGKIAAAGYLQSGATSFQLVSAANFQTFDTTQNLLLNVAFRLNAAALSGDIIAVKSARLFKLNNPS